MSELLPQLRPRRCLMSHPEIQVPLLARTALYWMLYHAVLWMAMFLYRYAENRAAVMGGAPPRSFSDLYGQFLREHASLWVCAIVILPVVLWDLLKFTHRLVGPLVRFQRTLERLIAGEDVEAVRLRQGDLLFELQSTFNQYLASLRSPQAPAEFTQSQPTEHQIRKNDSAEAELAEELQRMQRQLQAACSPSNSTTRTSC